MTRADKLNRLAYMSDHESLIEETVSFATVLELPERKDRDGNAAEFNPDELVFMDFGSCKSEDPNLFNTETNHGKTSLRGWVTIGGVKMRKLAQVELAKGVCADCPVLEECALHIKRYPEGEGVWAGTIPEERN